MQNGLCYKYGAPSQASERVVFPSYSIHFLCWVTFFGIFIGVLH